MSAILILPFLTFILLFFGYLKERDILHVILSASVLFAGCTVLGAELLSLFSFYNLWGLLIFWLILTVISVVVFRKQMIEGIKTIRTFRNPELTALEWVCAIIVFVFLGATLYSALAIPPSLPYDSMSYHMPRVFFWMKNESVHNYATIDGRQLFVGPFGSFNVLQFQVLNFGKDFMANTVQWFAYAGAILSVFGISRELGAKRPACFASAVLTAAVPLAFVQARTTQNDLLTASLCTLVIYYVVWFIRRKPEGKDSFIWALLTGLAGGAAVLTKNTAYPVLAPFALLLIIMTIKDLGIKGLAKLSGTVVAIVLLMNIGFYTRNVIELGADPLATNAPTLSHTQIRTTSLRYRAAALLYNTSKNFTTGNAEINHNINEFVNDAVNRLGVDPLTDNIENRIIEHNNPVYIVLHSHLDMFNTDVAPAPMHALLLVISSIVLLIMFLMKKVNDRLLLLYPIACFFAFFILAITVIVSSSVPRYMLAVLLPSLAFVVIPFQNGNFRIALISIIISLITLQTANAMTHISRVTPALRHDMRRLTLFLSDPNDYDYIWNKVISSGVTKIGVNNSGLAFYPWLYLWRESEYDVRMINTSIHTRGELSDFVPEALFMYISAAQAEEGVKNIVLEYNGQSYSAVAHAFNAPFEIYNVLLMRDE